MNIDNAFDKLVDDLDDTALAGLNRAVSRAVAERRERTALQLEEIHPRMTDADRLRARQDIARVLRGEE